MSRPVTPPLFSSFSWLPDSLKGNLSASFVADSMDAWRGVETCLNIVNSCELDRAHNTWADPGDEVPPLLSVADSERLMRLAIITARTWERNCENHLQWLASRAEEVEHLPGRDSKGGAK